MENKNYKNLFNLYRNLNDFFLPIKEDSKLNKTERKLLAMLYVAEEDGEKIIATQIAKKLGITRSAVSQTVNKLESLQYVKRVSCLTDKKIAYIELSASTKLRYREKTAQKSEILEKVALRMGEENIQKLFNYADNLTYLLKEYKKEFYKRK